MSNEAIRPTFLSDDTLQLLLFGGKGGVGKTTSALASAFHLAHNFPDKNFLLVSTDPAHSLQDGLGEQATLFCPPNLAIVELDAQEYLAQFKEKHSAHLHEIARRGTFLDDADINQFLALSLPGLDELMAFLRISEWVADTTYSCVIVDTAPTGHTLRLLGMPELLNRWLGMLDALLAKQRYMKKLFSGNYYGDELDQFLLELTASVTQLKTLLTDPLRCRFVPIMLAEALSIDETQRLLTELQRLEISVTEIVINRLYPENDCAACRAARQQQLHELSAPLQHTTFAPYQFWHSALQPLEICGVEQLTHFWDNLTPLNTQLVTDAPANTPDHSFLTALTNIPLPRASLLFFAGKGGVGKTTLACATALRLAEKQGKKVLLCSTDPAHSIADCLDQPIGAEPVPINANLTALEIDAHAEFAALRAEYAADLKTFLQATLKNLDFTFDREVMERVLDLAPPGLDEVMALLRVIAAQKQGQYDVIVLDTAPTGHLIRLLEMPELIDHWLKAFFGLFLKYRNIFRLPRISQLLVEMSKNLKQLRALLADKNQACVHVVSIPTAMALAETKDLIAACTRMNISVGGLFINMVTPPSACNLCSAWAQSEAAVRDNFQQSFPAISQAVIPRQGNLRGATKLSQLGQTIYQNELVRGAAR